MTRGEEHTVGDAFSIDSEAARLSDVPGFKTGAAACGLAPDGADIGVILCEADGGSGTALFTRNKLRAPSVGVSSPRAMSGKLRGVVITGTNANALLGTDAESDAIEMVNLAEAGLGVTNAQLMVASAGVSGVALTMDAVRAGVSEACANAKDPGNADLAPVLGQSGANCKIASVSGALDGKPFRIAGMARIAQPGSLDAAGMFVFIVTDANIEGGCLREVLMSVYERTFDRFIGDAGGSTNDTLCVLASGLAGNDLIDNQFSAGDFSEALEALCRGLMESDCVGLDGHAPTKIIEVNVSKAGSEKEADAAARSIAGSVLLRSAVASGEASWVAALSAAGQSQAKVKAESAIVKFCGESLYERGEPVSVDEAVMKEKLASQVVTVDVELGAGSEKASAWSVGLPAGGDPEALQQFQEEAAEAKAAAEQAQARLSEIEPRLAEVEAARAEFEQKFMQADAQREAAAGESQRRQTQIITLEKTAQDLKASAEQKAAEAQKALREFEEKLKAEQAAREAAAKEAEAKTKELEALRQQVNDAQSEIEKSKASLGDIAKAREEAEKTRSELELKIKEIADARDAAAQESEAKTRQLEASRVELETKLKETVADREKVAKEAEQASQRLQSVEQEAEQARNTVALTKQSLQELEKKHTGAEGSRVQLEQQLKETEVARDQAVARNKDLDQKVKELRKTADEAEKLAQRVADLEEDLAATKGEATESAKKITELEKAAAGAAKTEKRAAELEQGLAKAREEASASAKKIKELEKGAAAAEKVEKKVAGLEKDLAAAKNEATEAAKRVKTMEKNAAAAKDGAAGAEKRMAELEKELSKARSKADKLALDLKSAKEDHKSASAASDGQAKDLEAARKDVDGMRSELETARKTIENLEDKVDGQDEQIADLKAKMKNEEDGRKKAEKEVKRLNTRVEKMEGAARPDLEDLLDELKKELEASEVVKQDLKTRLAQVEGGANAQIEKLKAAAKKAIEDAKQVSNNFALKEQLLKQLLDEDKERREVKKRNEALENELEDLKKELAKAKK